MKKKYSAKTWICCILLLISCKLLSSALVGNSLSGVLIHRAAEDYLAEQYPDHDLLIVNVLYQANRGDYEVFIWSPTQDDLEFRLYYSHFVRLKEDTYEADVASGYNTWKRLDSDYDFMLSALTEKDDFPYTLNYANGRLRTDADCDYGLTMSTLEVGTENDVQRLGAQHGELTFFILNQELTYDRAVAVMRDIVSILDRSDISFHSMTVALQQPNSDGTIDRNRSIYATDFTREDIFAEDAAARVEASDRAEKAS